MCSLKFAARKSLVDPLHNLQAENLELQSVLLLIDLVRVIESLECDQCILLPPINDLRLGGLLSVLGRKVVKQEVNDHLEWLVSQRIQETDLGLELIQDSLSLRLLLVIQSLGVLLLELFVPVLSLDEPHVSVVALSQGDINDFPAAAMIREEYQDS